MRSNFFGCTTCYKNFKTADSLGLHKQACVLSAEKCPHCGKMYESRVSLKNHVNYKHPTSCDFWCVLCRRAFRSARGLANHLAVFHGPKGTVCEECERSFPSAAALRSHCLHRHRRGLDRALCPLCGKVFVSALSVEKHVLRQHPPAPAQPHSCAVCEAAFQTTADLDTHLIQKHNLTELQSKIKDI